VSGAAERSLGRLSDYVSIARPSHWVKHIFILPGIGLALLLIGTPEAPLWWSLLLGLMSAAAIASANYVLNEWLDADFDRHHPVKSQRPLAQSRLSRPMVLLEYAGLSVVGLGIASLVSPLFFYTSMAFFVSGLLYNVPPVRLKDRALLDVTVEAVNNPIRLVLGWAMVDASTLPPGSIILSYWMGGAFLMTVKRLAERRTVVEAGGRDSLPLYRRSFGTYTESFLLVQALTCALLTAFFLAVFLVKYRIEYLLVVPLLVALFGNYLRLGLQRGSAAEAPEKLYREPTLLALVLLLLVAVVALTVYDVPALEHLTDPHYIELDF